MEFTSNLVRKAFVVLVVLVGLLLMVNLPPADEVRSRPSSKLVRFSVDHRVTAVHRNLRQARHAESMGDSDARTPGGSSVEHFEEALGHLRRAGELSHEYRSGGYLPKLVRDSVVRVQRKLKESR